jgi:hypothetical protein
VETLKTIATDISKTVFENDTEAILYITKDIYSDSFIVAVPVITFSWQIWEDRAEQDYNELLKFNLFGDIDKRERLVAEIKKGIAKFRNSH